MANSKFKKKDVEKFIHESNKIEDENSIVAHDDAMKAWEYLKYKSFLTPEVILGVHHFLMGRIAPEIAGEWRTCAVRIGGHTKKFVSTQLIQEQVNNVLLMMGTSPELPQKDLEDWVINSHVLFEDVHPFVDGNGRTGRLIYLWHRMKLGLPIHIIHADMDKKGEKGEQWAYYQWFRTA